MISWWTSCFITMKGAELIRLYYNTWWEEVRAIYSACIILVYNSSTVFANYLLSNVEICNNWMDSCCIIVGGKWRTKMTKELTWNDQCSWGSNHFYVTIESMNIYPAYIKDFMLLSRNMNISVILDTITALGLSPFENVFMYQKRSPVGYKVYSEKLIYCWSMIILLLKCSSCCLFFNFRVARSDWTSPFIPQR